MITHLTAPAAALATVLLLAACAPTTGVDLPPEPSGPPCTATPGDEAQIVLLPGDWPDPPVGALLCRISADPDRFEERADYRYGGALDEAAAAYRRALPASAIEPAEHDDALAGRVGGTRFRLLGTADGYAVVFAEIPMCLPSDSAC